jgi:hypothetical protein
MINTILAYDERDVILGEFFDLCAIKTKDSISDGVNLIEINSQSLNDLTIQFKTEALNSKPFLFITFTHGSESELLKSGSIPFLSTTINEKGLKNSLSYCFACNSGKELGHTLIENGALAFVGYKEEVTVQKFFDALDSFVECATCGLKYFFSEMSLANSISLMKEKYTDCMDRFYSRDMIIASSFMENRDALVLLGKKDLAIKDFYV